MCCVLWLGLRQTVPIFGYTFFFRKIVEVKIFGIPAFNISVFLWVIKNIPFTKQNKISIITPKNTCSPPLSWKWFRLYQLKSLNMTATYRISVNGSVKNARVSGYLILTSSTLRYAQHRYSVTHIHIGFSTTDPIFRIFDCLETLNCKWLGEQETQYVGLTKLGRRSTSSSLQLTALDFYIIVYHILQVNFKPKIKLSAYLVSMNYYITFKTKCIFNLTHAIYFY